MKARDLGIIGEEHVLRMIGGEPSATRYKKVEIEVDGVPYLIEAAFGCRPGSRLSHLVAALNWSTSVAGNPFDRLGKYSVGLESSWPTSARAARRADRLLPACRAPRPAFLDKGKSSVDLPVEVDEAIVVAVKYVTAAWAKQRKGEERARARGCRRMDALTVAAKPMSIRDAAFSVMARAYADASDNGEAAGERASDFLRGETRDHTPRGSGHGRQRTVHARTAH